MKRLLADHVRCHVTWLHQKELDRFAQAKDVELHHVDAAQEDQVGRFYEGLPGLWASIHLVGGFAMSPIDRTSADDMRKMFEMNAMTCFLCCRESVKKMRTAAAGGRIVNVAARPAVQPIGGMIAYSSSKACVASITQSLAEEVKNERILVNAVLPSIMDTPANRKSIPNADFAKWPKVEQVAETIAFLASEQNMLTSGALVPVYGQS